MIKEERNRKQSLALVLLVIATLCTVFLMTRDVQAAKAGFKTINSQRSQAERLADSERQEILF